VQDEQKTHPGELLEDRLFADTGITHMQATYDLWQAQHKARKKITGSL